MCKIYLKLCSNPITKQPPLSCFVRSRQLTECLDWIEENLGFTGDAAIFLISLVNKKEVK